MPIQIISSLHFSALIRLVFSSNLVVSYLVLLNLRIECFVGHSLGAARRRTMLFRTAKHPRGCAGRVLIERSVDGHVPDACSTVESVIA